MILLTLGGTGLAGLPWGLEAPRRGGPAGQGLVRTGVIGGVASLPALPGRRRNWSTRGAPGGAAGHPRRTWS
jgi:hypothetical protein